MKQLYHLFSIFIIAAAMFNSATANDISVKNAKLTGKNTTAGTTMVQFDISWENSWRTSSAPNNWDAAWVFVKYKVNGNYVSAAGATSSLTDNTITVSSTTGLRIGMPVSVTTGSGAFAAGTVVTAINSATTFTVSSAPTLVLRTTQNVVTGTAIWEHATVSATGHTAPAGSTIMPANDGTGAFMYRSTDGMGTNTWTGSKLQWQYANNNVADNAMVDVQVFAIEMVYVPEGAFSVGSGGTENGTFTNGSWWATDIAVPFTIASEDALTIGTSTGNLYGTSYLSGNNTIGSSGTLAASFPKGYAAFYSMKYEISQQAYVDFLNSLTQTQATGRKYTGTDSRYGISGSAIGSYATTNPNVACNYINWADVAAYLDWSCLRPMTELEYEKACRGTASPVANEYAWGTAGIAGVAYTLNNSGATNEFIGSNYSITVGNAVYDITGASVSGPVRAGIFAGTSGNTGRVTAGATYYGIMEMSGNVMERPVTVGNATGRAYTGTHGNGALDATTGNADASTWPGTSAEGAGFRGGSWGDLNTYLQVSSRFNAALTLNSRYYTTGGRGIRTEPLAYSAPGATTDPLMIPVAGGTFSANESTPQTVIISGFNIDKYEVTYDKWTAVRAWGVLAEHGYTDLYAGTNGYSPVGANNPVTSVIWYDIVKWCNARSEMAGLTPVYYTDISQTMVYKTGQVDINTVNVKWTANGYRLPTEAEWEFAAKGGTLSKGYTYSGSNTVGDVAWHSANSGSSTHTVGTKTANELGIYDMSGNAYEWCWDWHSGSYPNVGTTNPQGPTTTQTYRVLRGGSFGDDGFYCRSAYRYNFSYNYYPNACPYYNGFRCVQD